MKRVLLALALAGLGVGIAHAQVSDLSNGVFITHYPPGSVYTNSDQCAWYANYAITDCQQQNPRFDSVDRGIWYVLAAWSGDKNFCGAEFGFGDFDPAALWFAAFGPCPATALPIPFGVWPGPGAGVSLAATSDPWVGNLLPVYWFDVLAYYPALLQLGPNPGTGFGGFANCLTPPVSYPAICFGGMGLFVDGVRCCPPVPTEHVCCVGDVCYLVLTADECGAMGGVYHPEWDSCADNPCYVPPQPDVCCLVHICYFVTETECAAMGGAWHPEFESCDVQPNPCDIYTPVEPSSWGAIKSIYR